MKDFDGRKAGFGLQGRDVESQADFDVLLRQIIAVDQHLANLVRRIRIVALLGVVILNQKVSVAMLDHGL